MEEFVIFKYLKAPMYKPDVHEQDFKVFLAKRSYTWVVTWSAFEADLGHQEVRHWFSAPAPGASPWSFDEYPTVCLIPYSFLT